MKNLKEVLNKLEEGIVIDSISEKELIIETIIGNLRVSYDIQSSSFTSIPFKAILRIVKDKQNIVLYTWGCSSNDENKELLEWFNFFYNEIDNIKREKRRTIEESFKQWLKE